MGYFDSIPAPTSKVGKEHGKEYDLEIEYPVIADGLLHCPAAVLPYLDEQLLEENRFRLARVKRAQTKLLGCKELGQIIDECTKHLIFLVIEGLTHERSEAVETWLSDRNNVSGELSGRDEKGEHRLPLPEYADRLRGYIEGRRPWDGVLGNFVITEEGPQEADLDWLESSPLLSPYLHGNAKGGMAGMGFERTQLGPYSFGGDKRRSKYRWKIFQPDEPGGDEDGGGSGASGSPTLLAPAIPTPSKRSRRDTTSNPRLGYGGSTMHLDGMGTYFAAGYIKDGEKRITAVEAQDALFALKVASFRAYAKPGGSEHATNLPLTRMLRQRWRDNGVRWGRFNISKDDFYFIPCGIPHEFENVQPSLSVAWNFLPKGVKSNAMVLQQMYYAQSRLREDLGSQKDRMKALMDHAPETLLLRRLHLRHRPVAAPVTVLASSSSGRISKPTPPALKTRAKSASETSAGVGIEADPSAAGSKPAEQGTMVECDACLEWHNLPQDAYGRQFKWAPNDRFECRMIDWMGAEQVCKENKCAKRATSY
jgi:hypothetical protein